MKSLALILLLFVCTSMRPKERTFVIGFIWQRAWWSPEAEKQPIDPNKICDYTATFWLMPAIDSNVDKPRKYWIKIVELPISKKKFLALSFYKEYCHRFGKVLVDRYRKQGYKVI